MNIPSSVAILGLGIIGSRVASRLTQAGIPLRTWNRTPKNLPTDASSAAEAAEAADLVCLFLKDAPAVREVVPAILPSLRPGAILANHSTIDLETTRWLIETCREAGTPFLDAPFTGSREAAAAGALVYYAAGDSTLIDAVEPILRHSSKSLIRCGEAGNATILKLVTNLISACTVQALSEALGTATLHGIPAQSLIDAVALNACGSTLAAMKLPTMAQGDFDTHFSLSNMLKDSRYALELAAAAGLETPAIRTVSQRMEELCRKGLADKDYSALAAPYVSA